MTVEILPTPPSHPQVRALIEALDAYLATLYAPEGNHLLDIDALMAPEVRFLAAWQGDQVLGCGAVRTMPGEAATGGRRYGEIKRMYVRPEARGQRLAERLLGELESGLRAQGIDRALLETGGDQIEAVRLYTRVGYQRRPAFGGYPDNGLSVFMEKSWPCP